MRKQRACRVGEIGLEGVLQEQQEFLAAYGWYCHIITADQLMNCHTHGLDRYGHLDFQLVLPIDGQVLHEIAGLLVDRVKQGERFSAGMHVSGVIENYDVLIIETVECERNPRPILRVILPDEKGNLKKEQMQGMYAAQFEKVSM